MNGTATTGGGTRPPVVEAVLAEARATAGTVGTVVPAKAHHAVEAPTADGRARSGTRVVSGMAVALHARSRGRTTAVPAAGKGVRTLAGAIGVSRFAKGVADEMSAVLARVGSRTGAMAVPATVSVR